MLAPCTLTPEHAGNITIQKIYSYISNDICNSRIIKYFRTFFFCCNFLLLSDRLVIQDYFFGLIGFLTLRFFDIADSFVIFYFFLYSSEMLQCGMYFSKMSGYPSNAFCYSTYYIFYFSVFVFMLLSFIFHYSVSLCF